ncbi:DUF6404 family protein [Duganella radicis]|uniref:Uncharacterized protein n=1 Tax=Duganella radicis TaxID=551988 RepID=A0A6L6PK03_9BURK|nr:DUF6404 family protein [Duganella radicis]MTV39324.1 hypothetical protein [Duganella radicis]
MTDFQRKKEAALALLRRTSITQRNYAPPTFPFLWRLGVQVPPPHFIGFFPLVLIMGLPFGFCGLGLYMMDLGDKDFNIGAATALVLLVTAFFGGGISFYYRTSARLHRLPAWKDL